MALIDAASSTAKITCSIRQAPHRRRRLKVALIIDARHPGAMKPLYS